MKHEMLPLTRETQDQATVVVAFWGRVATVPEPGVILSEVEWRAILTGHAEEAILVGELCDETPVAEVADTLLALTAAEQIEYVLRSSIGAPIRQWSLVQHAIAPHRR